MAQLTRKTAQDLARLASELQERKTDALRLFRPMPQQLQFFNSMAQERVLRGGNRCLPGWERIYDPVANKWRQLNKTTKPFHVWSYDSRTGRRVIAKASAPFIKGHDDFYKITLSNGQSFTATSEHLVLTTEGYRSVSYCLKNRDVLLVGPSFETSAQHSTKTTQGCLGHCCQGCHQCGEQLRGVQDSVRSFLPLQACGGERIRHALRVGDLVASCTRIHGRLREFRLSTMGYRCHFGILNEPECRTFSGDCRAYRKHIQLTLQSTELNGARFHTGGESRPCSSRIFDTDFYTSSSSHACGTLDIERPDECSPCAQSLGLTFQTHTTCKPDRTEHESCREDVAELRSFSGFDSPSFGQFQPGRQSRVSTCQTDTVCKSTGCHSSCSFDSPGTRKCFTSIVSCETLKASGVWDIHVYGTNNYLLAGIYHHNSGKSTCAAVEFASAVTGIGIHDCDGNQVEHKFPRDKSLVAWIVGFDQTHIGKTIYRLLFMPGAFKIIRDTETKEWRAFRPNDPDDAARIKDIRQAPPLIPHRLIDPKGWAWEDKANRVFSVCRLKNGTEIRAFSSKGHPPMGDSVDVLWLDEDLEHPEHVRELEMRLPSANGKMWWSVFPLSKNDALYSLHERAEREKHLANPVVQEFVIKFEDNAYIDREQIKARQDGMSNEEWRARNDGEFLVDSVLMFPSFHIDTHGTPKIDDRYDNEIDRLLRKTNGVPPEDWTRYLIVDPGHTLAAVLFAAVAPPDKFGELYYCYDELYLRMKSAEDMASAVRMKASGYSYEAFIMDWRAGRQTPMGYDTTIMEKYATAFKAQGLKSRLSGHSFIWGSDDVEAGNESVREMLRMQPNGRPKLLVGRHLEAIRFEFARYRKMVVGNSVKEKQVDKDNHLMSCLRYWCASQPEWHMPTKERVKSRAELLKEQIESMHSHANTVDGPVIMGVGAAV